MNLDDFERRRLAAGLRRLIEIAWTGHRPIRLVSILSVPAVVALAVPGLWWMLCAASTVIGLITEFFVLRWMRELLTRLDELDLAASRLVRNRVTETTVAIM